MNPEQRLEELNKTMAELQAEIAQAKADIAAAKAVSEPNIQDEAVNLDGGDGRGLQGNRDAEGSMITAKQTAIPKEGKEIFTPQDLFDYNQVMIKQVGEDWMQDPRFKEAADFYLQAKKDAGQEGELEYDAIQEFDKEGNPIPMFADEGTYGIDDPTHIMADGSIMKNSEMKKSTEPVKRTMGMKVDEGGGFSSVNEKDDFWKTQEGYDKAMEMYGNKPSWVKEPTMMFNPETQKYEKIKEEDKEQFEDVLFAPMPMLG